MGLAGSEVLLRRGFPIENIGALYYSVAPTNYNVTVRPSGQITVTHATQGHAIKPATIIPFFKRAGIPVQRERAGLVMLRSPGWTPLMDAGLEFMPKHPAERLPGEQVTFNPFTGVEMSNTGVGRTLRPYSPDEADKLRRSGKTYTPKTLIGGINPPFLPGFGLVTPSPTNLYPSSTPLGIQSLPVGTHTVSAKTTKIGKPEGIVSPGLAQPLTERQSVSNILKNSIFGSGLFE